MADTKLIGVIFSDDKLSGLTHEYLATIIDSLKRQAALAHYNVVLLNSNREMAGRESFLAQAKRTGCSGIVIANMHADDPEIEELIASKMPIAMIDQQVDGVINICSDNSQGIKELVKYIHSKGHRKIAYIRAEEGFAVADIRMQHFLESCEELGIEVPEEYICQGRFRDMRRAAFVTEELLRLPDPPTCIMYSDDFAAIGGINMLRARGLDVPADISMAGYDGLFIVSQFEPRMTTIYQDTVRMGEVAATELIKWISEGDNYLKQDVIHIPVKLIKGSTVDNLRHSKLVF